MFVHTKKQTKIIQINFIKNQFHEFKKNSRYWEL